MKWSNEELTSIAEDTRIDIQSAIDNLQGVQEFKDVYEYLKEALDVLNEIAEPFEESYERELQAERDYQNSEYMRSVI